MKNKLKVLTIAAAVAATGIGATPLHAYPSLRRAVTAAQQQQQQDPKTALYEKFYNAVQAKNEQEAFTTGQDYLSKHGTEKDTYTEYIRNWVTDYEKRQKLSVFADFYAASNAKDYNKTFTLGRQILSQQPDNLNILIGLANASYLANFAENRQFNNEGLTHARKALQLLEAGKEPVNLNPDNKDTTPYYPFKTKNDALAFLNLTIGDINLANNQTAEAANSYVKAASYDSFLKKEPSTYASLAQAYLLDYNRLKADFERYYAGKDESPESKAALENLNQVIDRIIDAQARVIAFAGTESKYQAAKTNAEQQFKGFYAFRNKGETGMPQYLASVQTKPLPQPVIVTIAAPTVAPPTDGASTTQPPTSQPTTAQPTTSASPAARPAATPATPANGTTTPARPAATPASPASPASRPTTPSRPNTTKPKASVTKPNASNVRRNG